jgi:hypothetical protein
MHAVPRLFIAAAMVVAFIGNAAGDTLLDPQARSGVSNFKEGLLNRAERVHLANPPI